MTQKERMLAGLPYKAWMDGLPEERARAQRACWEFNRLPPDARAERTALLRGRAEARKHLDLHAKGREALEERLVMLLGENRRGAQDHDLTPTV